MRWPIKKKVEFVCSVSICADDEKSIKKAIAEIKNKIGVGETYCFGAHNYSYKSVGKGKTS